ncbi:MAG: bacteriohemerythrin [Spirochaetaceae bacterium]|jgi:methyl-accepting chemotaxis protein|nr:bacteriohemerythrin [Spirochaetaceae bacterium]
MSVVFQNTLTILLFVAVLVLAASLISVCIYHFITVSPLKKALAVMEKNAAGDLSHSITVRATGETGKVFRFFNDLADSLRRLVITVETEGENLDDVGFELFSRMGDTAHAMSGIGAAVEAIRQRTRAQSASAQKTNAAMDLMTSAITALNREVEIQGRSVNQSSEAIEAMLANIRQVADICRANTENVARLAESSGVGRTDLEAMARDIQNIARDSEGLLEINAVIQSIASKTNLLSMNAAIEAAHAGEAGKGFAVVADEIRNLAKNSAKQSKTIGTALKKITDSIALIRQAANGVLEKFEAINSGVLCVMEGEERIRDDMEQQSAGSHQILETMEKLNDITRRVQTGAGKMRKACGAVIEERKNLETAAAEISEGVSEIASKIGEVNEAMEHLREAGGKNIRNVETLGKAVSQISISSNYYQWDNSFVTGIKLIDARHKRLFEMVNRLLDACDQGRGQTELAKSLDFLVNYTVKHFSEEEALQRQYGFPGFEGHRQLHENFKKTVGEFGRELKTRGPSQEMLERIKTQVGGWLVTHVKSVDSKMAASLKSAGAPSDG